MQRNLINPDTMEMDRATVCGAEQIRVFDEEGDKVLTLPGSLSDAEARTVIATINRIYSRGYENGGSMRARQIAKLLEIENCALTDGGWSDL
ncbi:TPA: hypothetical protein ACGQ50_000812 [Enterobacter cloacae]